MFNLPEAAIGAIVALLIAGTVSLLSLIISKEQKISDFRQSWIDSLRAEFTSYLVQINAIHDGIQVTYETQTKKVEALGKIYMKLNESTFNIMLRINPTEEKSKLILEALGRFNRVMLDETLITTDNIRRVERDFLHAAQSMLKYEWSRVKSGELAFRVAKVTSFLLVFLSIFVVFALIYVHFGNDIWMGVSTIVTKIRLLLVTDTPS